MGGRVVTTELELATLAFAALNGFMYFFWWNKPLDVRTTVPVYRLSTPLPKQGLFYHHTSQPILTQLFSPVCLEPESEKTLPESPLLITEGAAEQNQERSQKFHKYFGASSVISKSSQNQLKIYPSPPARMSYYSYHLHQTAIPHGHRHLLSTGRYDRIYWTKQ